MGSLSKASGDLTNTAGVALGTLGTVAITKMGVDLFRDIAAPKKSKKKKSFLEDPF